MNRNLVLFVLTFSQLACVSLWFLPNALLSGPLAVFPKSISIQGVTMMVQIGFILGTLFYAVFSLADIYSPSKVFFISALLAAACNLLFLLQVDSALWFYGIRLLTGFFLAGIYPVGMKIAADYFERDIGKALGYLVGALVVGTAFPYMLAGYSLQLTWREVILISSVLSMVSGLSIFFFIPDGPYRKAGSGFNPEAVLSVFKLPRFRKTAFGYFGHMWELYAFWAFIPLVIRFDVGADIQNANQWIFYVIGIGGLACILGGYFSKRIGSYKVALWALIGSGLCCFISPFIIHNQNHWQLPFLLLWGMLVVMDSPQFSSLIAKYAPVENRASALTIITCIGFSITVISILVLGILVKIMGITWLFWFLLPGPIFGVLAFIGMRNEAEEE
jgi:MFS family permease